MVSPLTTAVLVTVPQRPNLFRMRCMSLLLFLHVTSAAALSQALYMTRHTLPLASGKCTAGGPAVFYARNCSANWDSHSGVDYCPKGGPSDPIRYLIVFAGEDVRPLLDVSLSPTPPHAWDGTGAFCYSAQSCSSRSPNLTSTAGLPPLAFPGGLLSPYAEVNPNNYKSPSAFIPYCSSDLWAGSTSSAAGGLHFEGQRIALSVLAALAALPARASLLAADEVILVGPPGIAALPALAAAGGLLKPGAAVTLVCDGCTLLPSPLPLPPSPPPPCATDADCPPHLSLPLAAQLWAMPHPSQACHPALATWACLTVPALLAAPWGGGAARLLLVAQGGDARAAAAYGRGAAVAPALSAALQSAVAQAVGAGGGVLSRQGSGVYLSQACAAPSALSLHGDAFYGQVNAACRNGAGEARNDSLAQVLGADAECREAGVPADVCVPCWGPGGGDTCL